MKTKKYIVDTTLRDGEQGPGFAMTKEQKVCIANLLDEIGVYQIEAGIPAIGEYEIDTINEIYHNKKNAKISVWSRLNEDDIKLASKCKIDILHISVPISYPQIYSKLNKNKAWILKEINKCIELAKSYNVEITIGFEDASRADITFMLTVAEKLKQMGINRIRFADTVGVLNPSKCSRAIEDLIKYAGVEIEMHAHNDLGMAVANSISAAKSDAKYIDTTILGIGERAGNCNFSQLIYASDRIFDWGISYLDCLEVEKIFSSTIKYYS